MSQIYLGVVAKATSDASELTLPYIIIIIIICAGSDSPSLISHLAVVAMHNSGDAAWTTTILVKNIHCASCVAYVQRILGRFGNTVHQIDISIQSHKVRVLHDTKLSASELCRSLSDAAFEIYSAVTLDGNGRKVQELGHEDSGDGWFEAATGLWNSSSKSSTGNEDIQLVDRNRRTSHLMNCIACQKEANRHLGMSKSSTTTSLESRHEGRHALGEKGFLNASPLEVGQSTPGSSVTNIPQSGPTNQHSHSDERFEAILSIGGMTCASCTNAIDHGLSTNELPFVESVNVTLMTNSARVVFRGKDNLQKIVQTVEDLGYDAASERCDIIADQPQEDRSSKNKRKRMVMLKIDGMFCQHCPPRILETIKTKYPETITIDKPPTFKDPIMIVIYSPSPPDLGIRQIISTVESVDGLFHARIHTPPSIEQRSQATQRHEQKRLLYRLFLSFIVAIPTFLIGVVWMSLVPSSNRVRRFFELVQWGGADTRADWAMFILATPIFLFAADVFHIRAIKVSAFPH